MGARIVYNTIEMIDPEQQNKNDIPGRITRESRNEPDGGV